MRMMGLGAVPCFNTGHPALSKHSLSLASALLELMSLPKYHNFGKNDTIPLEASLPHLALHIPGLGNLT